VTGTASVPLLHQDAQLLAVSKPAGRLVIPGRGRDERSLVEELSEVHGRLWVVHRLDRGTTGVLIFARSAEAHRALNLAFDRGEPRKRYLALVAGTPPPELRVDVPLAPARRGRMRPARPGEAHAKPSATVVRLLEAFPPRPWAGGILSLVEALPETGRTHQIRVHLAHAHHPLAFDPDYGREDPLLGSDGRTLLDRTPLHASRLELVHPASGRPLVLEAPLPEDMACALQALRAGP
jgi:tRNA pseudouridine32 synthase/23S rRNA pseudouridine746 synthase